MENEKKLRVFHPVDSNVYVVVEVSRGSLVERIYENKIRRNNLLVTVSIPHPELFDKLCAGYLLQGDEEVTNAYTS